MAGGSSGSGGGRGARRPLLGMALPLAALLAAAVAAGAAGSWQAHDAGTAAGEARPADAAGQWAHPLPLLPQAHATVHVSNMKVIGSHQFQIHWDLSMVDMRSKLGQPAFTPGGTRNIVGMTGHLTPNHVYTVDGAALSPSATGYVVMRHGDYYSPPGHGHGHRSWYDWRLNLADGQAPTLDRSSTPTLDLSRGTITFRADERLHASNPSPQNIRIIGAGHTLSSSSAVSITPVGGGAYGSSDVVVTLTGHDHEVLDRNMGSRTSTTMKIGGMGLYDSAGNSFNTGRWWEAMNVVRDTAPPVLARNPQLDFNTGVLTITFDEPVTYVYLPYLFLEDSRGGSRQHVSGASYPSGLDSTVVPITLSASQLERLASLHLASGGLRLDMHRGIVRDVVGNVFAGVFDRTIDVTADTTRPALEPGRSPVVDLSRHTVSLVFDERMDVSESNPAVVRLLNSSGPGVPLAGESARGYDGATVTLSLSKLNKARIAEMGTPLRIAFGADAFKDVWGNAAPASSGVAASVRADTTRPGVQGTPQLDMNDGMLTVPHSEAVYRISPSGYALLVSDPSSPAQRTRVGLAGAHVAMERPYAVDVDIQLTEAQRAAVASAGGPSPAVRLTIGGWAYHDYPAGNRGWYVSHSGIGVGVVGDTTPPRNATAPVLDLDAGTVAIEFDEYIDASAFDPAGMAIVPSSGPPIPMGNSTLSPAADGALVMLNMTGAGAAEAGAADRRGADLRLTVPATAFSDMSGNAYAGLDNATIIEAGGAGLPGLAGGAAPVLELSNGTLEIRFDEGVIVPSDLSGIAVSGRGGPVLAGLAGAAAAEGAGNVSDTVTIDLTPLQKALLAAEYAGGNGSGRLAIDIARDVFVPEVGRGFPGLSNTTLTVMPDGRAPDLAGTPSISPAARTVTLPFDEYIDLARVDAGGIVVHDGMGGAVAGLAGAAVSSPDGAAYGGELVVTMTPAQGFAVIVAALRGDVYLNVSGSAVYDVSGNPYGGLDTSDSSAAADGGGQAVGRQSASAEAPPARAAAQEGAPVKLAPLPPQPHAVPPLGIDLVFGSPPQLRAVPEPVRLDLGTGVLEIEFDQLVSLAATNLTGAEIRGAGTTVGLEGAGVPADGILDSTVVVRLTPAQKAGAVAAGPAALLHLPAGFASLLGPPSEAVAGARIAVAADSAPPSIDAGRTVLDLGAGRLAVSYDEHVAGPPGGLDPGAFAVALGGNGSGGRIPLAGAFAAAAANDTVVVSLAPPQKARLDRAAALDAQAMRLDAAAGAALDLSGNPSGRVSGANLSVALDAAPPALAGAPILNLGTGSVTLAFDEFVEAGSLAPQAVTVTDRDGNGAESPMPAAGAGAGAGGDDTRLALEFSPAQAAALRAANASAGPLRIAVAAGSGIADLSGNAFAGLPGGGALTTVDDSVPPAILPGTSPALDIGTGVLSIMFTEHVPASGIDLSGAAIEDANGAVRVPLSGARIVPPSGPEVQYRTVEDDTLRIFLTADQKGAVARAHIEAGPVRLDLPSESISDAAGLRFAGLSNAPLAVAADSAGPQIRDRALPSLDMAHGLLTVPFDEYIDAAGADMSGFELSGRPPGSQGANASVPLAGAGLASELDGAELRVRVEPRQLAALTGGGLTGIPPEVYLSIAPGAVRDVSGNAFAGLDGGLIEALPDEAPPALPSPPIIDLDDGIVVVSFDEYVAATALNASGVSLVGDGSAGPGPGAPAGAGGPAMVRLSGAAVSAHGPSIPLSGGGLGSQSVLIEMTADQKAEAVLARALEIDIDGPAAGLTDLSGNAYGGIERGLAYVVPDETGPDADAPGSARTPSLDMRTGTLAMPFDEHVDPSSIDPSRVVIAVSSAPAPAPAGASSPPDRAPPPSTVRVGLAGAAPSVSASSPPSAYLVLTADQKAAVQRALEAHGGPQDAIASVDAARGAAADLSGNAMPAARGLAASVMADAEGPALASPAGGHPPAALDLVRGTIALEFDEHAGPQDARPGRLSLSGPGGIPVSLAGASFSSISSSAILEMRLTAAQAAAARSLHNDTGGRIMLVQSGPGAFSDLAGNPSGRGLTPPAGLPVSVAPEGAAAPIRLASADVDLAGGTVELVFDGNVSVPALDLSRIAVLGGDRTGGSTPLHGASVQPDAASASRIAIALTGAQKASIAASYAATGSAGAAVDAAPSAVRDRFYRAFEGAAAFPADLVRDRAPPVLSGATVDLSAGTVLVELDEFVDPGSVDASAVSVAAPAPANASAQAAAPVRLDGARVLTLGGSQSVLLAMTAGQKAAVSSLLGASGAGELHVRTAAGALADVSENRQDAPDMAEARVVHDASPPSLDALHSAPVLDLGAGTLAMSFDEHVAAASSPSSPSVSLSAASPGAHPVRLSGSQQQGGGGGGSSTSVTLLLTPAQKGALLSGGPGAAESARLFLDAGAFADLAGNPSSPSRLPRIEAVADAVAPGIDPAHPPVLDMGSGALSIAFDEYVDPAALDLSGLSVSSGVQDAVRIALTDARIEPPAGGTDAVTLLLTRAERGAVAAALGPPPHADGAVLHIAAGAFADLSGNPAAAGAIGISAVAPDRIPPHLDRSADPLLNLALSPPVLELDFDEHIDARAANLSLAALRISGAAGGGPGAVIGLAGAEASGASSPAGDHRIRIALTAGQAGDLEAALGGPGYPARPYLDAAAGAFADLAGNRLGALGNHTVLVARDAVAPFLASSPELDLDGRLLVLSFSEPVRLSAPGDASEVRISGASGSHPFSLGGGAVVAAPAGASYGTSIEVRLGASQSERAKLAMLADGDLLVTVPAGAVHDRAYNHFAGLDGAHLFVDPDTRGPAVAGLGAAAPPLPPGRSAAVLDLAHGLITVQLDEHVDSARIDLAGASVSRASATVGLAGAAAEPGGAAAASPADAASSPSTALRVLLTHAQKSELSSAGGPSEAAATLSIPAGALYDLAGNPSPAAAGIPLAVVPDTIPPSVDAPSILPVLDLADGTIEIHFDEGVSPAAGAFAGMRGAGGGGGGGGQAGPAYAPGIDIAVFDGSAGGDGRHRIPLGGHATLANGTDGDTVAARIAPDQKAALVEAVRASALLGFGAPATLLLGDGLVSDLSGNGLAGYGAAAGRTGGVAAAIVHDDRPPALDASRPPALDMGSGVLSVWFDEYVRAGPAADAPAAPLALVVRPQGNASDPVRIGIPLDSLASPPGWAGSDEIAVYLTPGQKAAVAAASGRAQEPSAQPAPVSIEIAAGAVSDLWGNAFAGASQAAQAQVQVQVRADASPPVLGRPPVLNTAAGTVLIDLDEFADARAADASGISLSGGGAHAMLDAANTGVEAAQAGAPGLPGNYSDRIVARPAQGALAAVAVHASQPFSYATMNISAGALADLAGNPAGALARAPVEATDDDSPPALLNATVDLADGDVILEFGEPVDAAGAVLSGMRLVGAPREGADAPAVPLAGASLLLPNGGQPDGRVEMRLSGAQKAAAAAAYSASPQSLRLEAPAGAVGDPYGNPSAAIDEAASVRPDRTPPAVLSGRLSPVLDLGAGTLALRFSEHVDAGAIDPSGISVRGTGGATAQLAGAAVADPPASGYAGAIVLDLPAALKAAAAQAAGPRTLAGTLDIAAGASVRDASSNPLGAAQGLRMLVLPDRAPPRIDAAATVVDLRAGVVTIAVDEYVRLSSVDVSRIAVGPPPPPPPPPAAAGAGAGVGAAPVGLGSAPSSSLAQPAAVDASQGAFSDRIAIRMAAGQAAAIAASLAAAPAAGASGSAYLYVEPGAFADLSGNAHAGVSGLPAGATPPPVSVVSAAVTGPGAASVEYTYDRLLAGPQDYSLSVGGAVRTVASVDGSGSSAVHALAFEPADAAADATGTVSIAPLSGEGYVFGGAGPIAVSDGQGPAAVQAAALGPSSLSLRFDEPVAGVDAADLSVEAGAGAPADVEVLSVDGTGRSRTVLLGSPALAGGAPGTVTVLGGSYEDLAGNPSPPAAEALQIEPAAAAVRAADEAPVPVTTDSIARSVAGPSPSIDLSAVNGTFPAGGNFTLTAEGRGGPGAPPLAVVTFAAGTTATASPAAQGPGAPPRLVISVSEAAADAAGRLLPDRSAVGGGPLGPLVEIGAGGNRTVEFDRPARIFLPGAAGSDAFWISPGRPAELIAAACASPVDTAAVEAQLGGAGQCAADHMGGKVIYTHHLTVFGTVAPPAPRAALPAPPGHEGPAAPAGACSDDPSRCSYAAFDAAPGLPRLAGPSAAAAAGPAAGPAGGRTTIYAAGPASDPALGDSIYAIDAPGGAAPAEMRPELEEGRPRAALRILDMLPVGAPPSPGGAAPYVLASATSSPIPQGNSAHSLPPSPVLLVVDAQERAVAGHAPLSYVDHLGRAEYRAAPALLGAHAGGGGGPGGAGAGAAYAGMQLAGPDGRSLAGGPVLLVDASAAPDVEVVQIYGDPDGGAGGERMPPSPSGYYYPREGWQPTAMAAHGSTVYMVGAAWQPGAWTAGQGALPNSYGLHTLSFAANGSDAAAAAGEGAVQPRYALVSSIEAARLPDRAADNSSYTAAGMAVDAARSKLYVLYENGTLAAYSLAAGLGSGAQGTPVPSFLYHVDTAVVDPRDLALDGGTGILYAASGGAVRVYDAQRDRLIAAVPVLGGSGSGSGGIASLALAAPALGQAGPDVYAVPSSPDEPVRIVRASVGDAMPQPPPLVASVSAAAGSYPAGSSVDIAVRFSRAVDAAGAPELALDVGRPGGAAAAVYASGSGTASLAFSYTVQAGDSSADLLYSGTGALSLPAGASISGASDGAPASLALPPPGPLAGAGAGAVRIEGGAAGGGSAVPPVVVVDPAAGADPGAAPPGPGFAGSGGGGSGGGGGGGGGGGSGRIGLAVGAGPSLGVSSVSWDCDRGLAWISVGGLPAGGAAAALPDVSILASSGTTAARAVPGAAGQNAAYEADLPEDDVFLVRATLVDGRDAASVSRTVRTGGQCAGEAVFDAGAAGAAAAPAAGGAAGQAAGMPDAAPGQEALASPEPQPPAPSGGEGAAGDGSGDQAPEQAPPARAQEAPEPAAEAKSEAEAEPPAQDLQQEQPPPDAPAQQEPGMAGSGGAADGGGGCLVATAAYGTELAPQVQALREVRDGAVMQTGAGAALLSTFNAAYYAVSPQVADLERGHPMFRDAVRAAIAPLLYSAQVLSLAEPGSDVGILAYGAAAIAMAAGLYAAAPAAASRLAPAARRRLWSCGGEGRR